MQPVLPDGRLFGRIAKLKIDRIKREEAAGNNRGRILADFIKGRNK
jgi:hypothetical protein